MAKTLFQRGSLATIADAKSQTEAQFIKAYLETTYATDVLLRDFWKAQNRGAFSVIPADKLPDGKKVTFKVTKDEKKKAPKEKLAMTTEELKELEQFEIAFPEPPEAVPAHNVTVTVIEAGAMAKTIVEANSPLLFEKYTDTKRNRGRQPLANADARDARILQLLKENVPGRKIVEQMTKDGYTVHAPQVTAIKKKWEAEEEQGN